VAGNSTECGRSVASKIVAILMTFRNGEVLTLTEVARLADMPTSTVHRLISELAAWGVLERTEEAQYRVGAPLRQICAQSSRVPGLHERARRVMEDLSAATRVEVRLGVLAERRVSYIEKLQGNRPISRFADGATAPAHATAMGKALLAFSQPGTVDMLISQGLKPYTPHTLVTADGLRRALATTRSSRLAVSRWELALGSCAIAVPVFGGGGTVVAALELKVRDLRDDVRALHPVLMVAARSMSRELAMSQMFDRGPLIGGQWGTAPVTACQLQDELVGALAV
jgi:IclR family acetate operon transcriptional repressor